MGTYRHTRLVWPGMEWDDKINDMTKSPDMEWDDKINDMTKSPGMEWDDKINDMTKSPGVIGSDVPWLECPACNALTWVITVTE